MNFSKLNNMVSGIVPWQENFGAGMERRGKDEMSWYDLSVNCNSLPCNSELTIIVTSWMGQLKWLKSVLTAYRLSGANVILAYDNPFYPWSINRSSQEMNRCMPNPNHYLLANSVVHKHITYDADKRNGWFWNVLYAQGIVRQFRNTKYVYITNGDCICENPAGFQDLINILGEKDVIAGQQNNDILHTATLFFKTEAFHTVFDDIYRVLKVPVLGSQSPERLLSETLTRLNINVQPVIEQPLDPKDGTVDMYARYDQNSLWKQVLGFKNLFAIQETLGNEGKEPVPKIYIDDYEDFLYFSGEEKETICQYYKTGDRRYLYMWLDRWEDSDYNRLYTPLDFYSKEPIYDKSKDIEIFRRI